MLRGRATPTAARLLLRGRSPVVRAHFVFKEIFNSSRRDTPGGNGDEGPRSARRQRQRGFLLASQEQRARRLSAASKEENSRDAEAKRRTQQSAPHERAEAEEGQRLLRKGSVGVAFFPSECRQTPLQKQLALSNSADQDQRLSSAAARSAKNGDRAGRLLQSAGQGSERVLQRGHSRHSAANKLAERKDVRRWRCCAGDSTRTEFSPLHGGALLEQSPFSGVRGSSRRKRNAHSVTAAAFLDFGSRRHSSL